MQEQIKTHLDQVYQEVTEALGFTPKCYFAGGCIASIVLNEEPKDYDLWFEMPENFNRLTNIYGPFKSAKVIKRTQYAMTVELPSGKIIQFVENRMGKAEDLVPQFDFQHTQSYYKPDTKVLSYDENFIKSRTLVFKGKFDHPINTLERVLKFSKRGFFVPPETLKTLMLEIKKLPEDSIKNACTHGGSM